MNYLILYYYKLFYKIYKFYFYFYFASIFQNLKSDQVLRYIINNKKTNQIALVSLVKLINEFSRLLT